MENKKPSSVDLILFTHWFDATDTPEEVKDKGEPMGYSDDVLIDVDGWRTTFRVGYKDTDSNEWFLYDHMVTIDLEGMKWTTLPLNKAELTNPN
jgi:hypothetical protein